MKKIFTKLMLWAVAATALVSCENKIDESTPVVELTQTVTLTAEKPVEVRTEMIEGVPYWNAEDAIGVYTQTEKDADYYKFTNDSEETTLTTSFTGQTAVANTLFVYYPYTTNGVGEKGAKVDIPVNQEPTATSFDGKADIMLAKPVTLDAEGKQLSDLEFARLGAIVKIVLKDNTSSLAGQHISSLTMTAANNLVGRVYIDVENQELGELYYGGSKSVNATYSEATQYEVNGENATYVIVYPQTLATDSTLSFEATTEGYAISKSIKLGQDIVLESGKLTTLTVNLAAANVVKEETGLDLPFEDDFARIAIDDSEGAISSLGDNYSSIEKIYKSKVTAGAVKFGTSSAAGHITTVPLNLSQPFTVVVGALGYKTGETVMKVTVGEVSQTINLTTSEAYYGVEFEAATKKSAVTIETAQDGKRFYLTDLKVVAGHDVVLPTLPPVLTVSSSELVVSHEASTQTFTYSVANPVEGTNVAISDNADWITTADNNGTVTVTVAVNEAEEAREGVITVTYGDLTKTVTVKQNAKPAEGGETASGWIRVTSLADITSGTYVIVANALGSDYYCPNSTFYSSTHPKAVTIAEKGVSVSGETLVGTVVDDMKWTFTGTATNMVITKYNGTAQLYNTGTNNGVSVGTPQTASYWKFTVQGSNFLATYNSTSRCLGVYNTQDWRSYQNTSSGLGNYKNTNGEIRLYKFVDGEGGGSTPEPEPATPVLSINPTTLSFDAAAGSKTVACTIENEVSGVNVTATESVDWLSTSVSGNTVTVTATENTTTSERTATVTIAYTGAESKTVAVTQAAAENTGGGSTGGTFTETFANYKASLSSSATSYACSGNFAGVSENGITWSYTGCGNPGQTATDITSLKSKGLTYDSGVTMGKSGTLSATIPGGATSVSFYILTSSKATCTVTIKNASGSTLKTQTVAKSTTGKVEITGINSNGGAITISFKEASNQNRVTVAGLEYTR